MYRTKTVQGKKNTWGSPSGSKIKSKDHQLDHDLEESLCNPFSPFKEFLLMKIFEVQLFLLLHSRSKSLKCFWFCKVNYCWTSTSIWKEIVILNIWTVLPEVLKFIDANTTRFPTEVSTWTNALPNPRAIVRMKLHPNSNFWSANTPAVLLVLLLLFYCCCIAAAFPLLLLMKLHCCRYWEKNQKREEVRGDRRDQRERRENQAKDFFQISFITTVSQRIREGKNSMKDR